MDNVCYPCKFIVLFYLENTNYTCKIHKTVLLFFQYIKAVNEPSYMGTIPDSESGTVEATWMSYRAFSRELQLEL